jgi:hypothetical protein
MECRGAVSVGAASSVRGNASEKFLRRFEGVPVNVRPISPDEHGRQTDKRRKNNSEQEAKGVSL